MYRCAMCRKPIDIHAKGIILQCDRCSSRVFFKDRPSLYVKKVKAR